MIFNNKNSQKVLITTLALVLLLVAGCQQISTETSEPQVFLSNSEQVLGFAALSAVEELQQEASVKEVNDEEFNQEKINSKLYIANTFLNENSQFNVDVQNSSLPGFDKTMTITYLDRNNNDNTHEFHYNETIVEVEDGETESMITGIIIVNGVEYTLEGTKEEEADEYEYDLIAFLDDENYLTIKYEVEIESASNIEKEFEYERFVDNQLVYRIEIEFEVEDGEKEINIKFLDGDFESEYSFERELENGGEEIKIEYKTSQAGIVVDEGEYSSYNELN